MAPRAGHLLAAAAVAFAATGCGGGPQVTKRQYLAKVNAICHTYERQLAKIPVPSFANLDEVEQSLDRVLPVVRKRADAVRAVKPPSADKERVKRMLGYTDDATEALEELRAAARRRDRVTVRDALERFLVKRDASRTQARALGITC